MDLERYFSRIQYTGPREPKLDVLRDLHHLHALSIPFENLDPLMGREIRLDLESLQRKMMHELRGGYCFEQNGLFMSVLKELGFKVRPLMARVRWQLPADVFPPRAHMVLLVDLDGQPWLADVGFGGLTPTAPIRMDVNREQETPHECMRVERRGDYHVLQAETAAGWGDVYQFTLEEQQPIDFEVANFWTSTHPGSRFTNTPLITKPGPEGRRFVLNNREFSVRQNNEVEKRQIETGEQLHALLREVFKLNLPAGTKIKGFD